MKKFMLLSLCMLLVLPMLAACREDKLPQRDEEKRITVNGETSHVAQDFTFDVNPTTFEVTIEKDGVKERASEPLPEMKVANLERGEDYISWTYPKENIEMFIQKQDKALAVELTTTGAESFQWPIVRADSYMLPLGEGKYIPSSDPNWKAFLEDEDMVFSESFSMRFFALNKKAYIDQGIDHLSEQQLYALNNQLLKDELKDTVDGMDEWGKKNSSNVLDQLHEAGLKQAWIGLPNWANGLMNPDMVNKADQLGYLIGPYDSYHSIHEVPNRAWNTASFKDASLYEEATVTGKNGEKIKGFLGRGRKLNPTLAMPSVKQRLEDILKEGIPYHTWFIDCDATGEFYDDYTPLHMTSQEQDMKARLERMDYVANDKQMVVGSEGGNDYASPVIAFARGIETPVIKWSDPDMRENKESPYYVGGYWSPDGSVPDRYSKQVPIKELYQHIYADPVYSLPLFKLVYNDSVITSHHWEWGSLKIQNEVANRMLVEFLYNVPPLYHLDSKEWEKQRELITSQVRAWSPFHEKAVQMPMTDFKVLSEDRLVQATTFGSNLKVIANFSDHDFAYEGATIKARSALIMDGEKTTEVTPKEK